MPSTGAVPGQLLRAIALSAFAIGILAAAQPVQAQTPTTTVLDVSAASSTFGQAVDLTATVSDVSATGHVTFYAGTTVLGTQSLAGGTAALETILLATGAHELRARYLGDGARAPSTSPVVPHTVVATAAGGLAPPVVHGGMNDPRAIAVADFNNDGVEDAIVADNLLRVAHVLLGNPDGTFQAPLSASTSDQPQDVAVGDLNEDGNTDAVLPDLGSGSVSVLLGNGDGTFAPVSAYASGGTTTRGVGVGDLNGDGHLDVIAVNNGSSNLGVLLGNGDGTLDAPVSYPVGNGPFRVTVADFNEDGHADLAAAVSSTGNVVVLLNDGSGAFPTTVPIPVPGNPIDAVAADVDDDGDVDLVVGLNGTSVSVLLNDGTGTLQPPVSYASTTFVRAVGTADLNGDGRQDVFASGDSGPSLFYGNGDGTLAPAIHYTSTSGATDAAVGDFNGDGRPDLAIAVFTGAINVALGLPSQTVFTSANQTTFTVTTPGSFTFTASGVPPPTFSVAPAPPTGLTLSPSGVLSGTPAPGTAGVYHLVVTASNGVAVDATQDFTLTIARTAQTITFANPGDTLTLMTSSVAIFTSSGLPATLESTTPAVCTAEGHAFTTHARGTCTLVARQAGDAGTYLPAPDVIQSLTVSRRPSTIVFHNLTSGQALATMTLGGSTSPGLRPVTISSDTPTVCSLTGPRTLFLKTRGTCTIVVRNPGDEVYEPAPDVINSFPVLGLAQTISFVNPGPRQLGGGPVPLTVFTTIAETQSQGLPVTLTSTTPAVCTTSDRNAVLLALGTCTIVASQAGDDAYDRATDVTQSFAVVLGTPDPPIGVVARVDGNFVSLAWSPAPTGATPDAYLVEIGDAPGRTTVTTVLMNRLGDTGLLPQGEYFMRVRAQNAAGLSEPSNDVWVRVTGSAPVALPPLAPTVSIAGSTVNFSWIPAAAGAPAERYLVQVSSDPLADELTRITVPAGTNVLSVAGVPPGTYALFVRAITGAGPSPPSPAIWLHVGPADQCSSAPASPLMLTPVVSDPVVALSWLPPGNGSARSFVVQAGTQAGQSDLADVDLGAVGGFGAMIGAGRYFIRTVSANDCGVSAPTIEQVVTMGGPAPEAPTGLTASHGPGGVTFTWTPAAAGAPATHYLVEAGLASGTSLVKFPVGATASLTIPGIPSGTTFVARVRAANAGGLGAASAEITVTVP